MSGRTRKGVTTSSSITNAVEENVENEGRKTRLKIRSANSSTPSRRSERSKSSTVLYNVPESSEESPSPGPSRTTRTRGRPKKQIVNKTPVRTRTISSDGEAEGVSNIVGKTEANGMKVGRSKRGTAQGVLEPGLEETRQKTQRRSTRVPKPVQRLVDEDAEVNVSSTKTPSHVSTPTVTESNESTRRSGRTRKGETPIDTPSSAKVMRKQDKSVTADDTPSSPKGLRKRHRSVDAVVETPATPRSSRKAATQKLTPKKTPKLKSTPTLASKNMDVKSGEVLQCKKLEWKFNVYGIPKCPLPCREAQFEEIWKFLFENVTEKNSGCMYVSGVPGTGKTVIVQAVITTMQKISDSEKKNLQFKYLYINGLTLASPDKIWKRMFKGLDLSSKSHGISTKEALKRLNSYFESHQRNPVILVVDELDQILDKQQSILYQLLEWSSHAKNMFSFVAIFNTMSLPENGLAMRNYSRMGFKRAVFPPYSYQQLHTIVSSMLTTFKSSKLSDDAVTLLSRKVAAISGDARRALELARRAMEIAEAGNISGIQAVSNTFKEIFSSAKTETIKHTSLLEQYILKAICDEVRCSGMEEVLTAKIYENVVPKAIYDGMQWPKDEILKALMRLALMHLVIVEDNVPSLHKRVLLKVPVEDVNYALGIENMEN